MMGKNLRLGATVGFAGGVAEIVWVGCYGALTGTPVAAVARGVASALIPGAATLPFAAGLGILLHMVLAVGLGIAVVGALRAPLLRQVHGWSQSTLVVLALAAVWSFNFLVLLPTMDPDFLVLLPMVVTLISKLAFGVCAAAVLRTRRAAFVAV